MNGDGQITRKKGNDRSTIRWRYSPPDATIAADMAEVRNLNPDGQPIRVFIADDHRTFAEALKTVIDLERGLVVTEVVTDGRSAVERVSMERPDVILLDLQMPEMDGITATREIKRANPDARVVVLSSDDDDLLMARAVEAGAAGFISKLRPVSEVAEAVRAAYRGDPLIDPDEIRRVLEELQNRREGESAIRARVERLTPRQIQILQLMADGLSPEHIAERLGISRHTLRTHVQNILTKLGVHSKLQALAEAIRYEKVVARRTEP
jgi:DNA-binding NarL/FixJ family response regulator